MNWKHWPYWLRGAVTGALGGLVISTLIAESCKSLVCALFSGGPAFIMLNVLQFLSIIDVSQFAGSFIFWRVVIFVSWMLCGLIVGMIVGYIKSRKTRFN